MKKYQLKEKIDSKLIATLDFEDFNALIRNKSAVKEWFVICQMVASR